MSITLPILIILIAVVLLISFLCHESPKSAKHKITLKELQNMHCSHPPVLVTTIKDGCIQETRCYFTAEEQENEPQIMEVIPDSDFVLKYRWQEKRLSI